MLHDHDASRPIAYSQRLCGRLTTVGPGLLDLELTRDDRATPGSSTRLTSQLSFVSERSFRERGTIAIAGRDAFAVTTLGRGDLSDAPHQGVRHGTAVLEVVGVGALAGARGRITSNFLVSADGEVIDEQTVVLFVGRGQASDHNMEGAPS